MTIRMYNCYFGDCFGVDNLLVDCGIHNFCNSPVKKSVRFTEIYNDISSKETDFLLSHYHEDHFNGVWYINKTQNYMFKDVYIPDIWSYEGCIAAVDLHLLR